MTHAMEYLDGIFSVSLFSMPEVSRLALILLFGYMVLEWIQRHRDHVLDIAHIRSRFLRYTIYFVLIFCVFYFAGDLQPFIYFQF